MALHLFQQTLVHRAFRSARGRIENVGAIANQRKNALVSDCGQFFFSGRLADDRIFVELPVARMEHAAVRCVDQQGVAFGNRVRQRNIRYFERADCEAAMIGVDHPQFHPAHQASFFKLSPHEVSSERRGVDRHAQFGSEIRYRADMIFVCMGQDDRIKLVGTILDEFQICKDQIHTGVLVSREGHAQIDHQPSALTTIEIDVHSDFARPAKCEEKQFVFGGEILLQAARSANMAKPSNVRSASTASNRSVCSSNRMASPPVATTLAGRPISFFIRAISPSIKAT